MKSFVAFFALVAVAIADVSHIVPHGESGAEIIKQDSDVRPDGFSYEYGTSNGISGKVAGQLQQIGNEAAVVQQGSLSYTAPDGQPISLQFTADENGYHPLGDHLPTPPAPQPIPDYILRSLEYIAAHPPQPETVRRV